MFDMLIRGILLQDAQRYDEAIESYRNAVKFRPSLACKLDVLV